MTVSGGGMGRCVHAVVKLGVALSLWRTVVAIASCQRNGGIQASIAKNMLQMPQL